jgi:hypothetical protein
MSGRCLASSSRRRKLTVLGLSGCLAGALAALPSATPSGADQVSSLQSQAKTIAHELIQEQLQADAYQQQYSVATERLADDERAIASTERQIVTDKSEIRARTQHVQRLAVLSYILTGSGTSTSGAAVFDENLGTIQATNEYASITIGNIDDAVDQLHTAQRTVQVQEGLLVEQRNRDQTEVNQQSAALTSANTTVTHMEGVQAQVTGQLAAAVAQQNARDAAAALAAVTAARKSANQNTALADSPYTNEGGVGPPGLADPALNPFLQCVVQAESGGNYQAVSPNGLYMGAFQFSQPTWNYAAQAAGLGSMVGVPPNTAEKAAQDTVAVALYSLDGETPWLGDRCSTA